MTKLIIDAHLRNLMFDLSQPLDLCDETGRVLGTFIPSAELPRDYDDPPLSEAEWRRREQEIDYSTDEVIARLEKL